mmetsp:Transcript_19517/g.23261  ORF Transcript_19517/g.23261 Transcript_19517/m.23261 type:complete len:563 (-) Transcript_19517:433-2121(-)
MAWHSGGESNTELVDNLVENGLISVSTVEKGFRNVDRKMFVPNGNEDIAYSDQPLKDGNIHISAPHIYCSVIEALDLRPNSCLSFLNIGAGTGYLSCIAAEILGPRSLNVGVEIQEDVVQHCRTSVSKWRSATMTSCGKRRAGSMTSNLDIGTIYPPIDIIHGNGLEISSKLGESVTGFDRIYIGAAIEKANLPKIKSLLSQGGILVAPVDDELLKIVRIGQKKDNATNTESDNYESTNDNIDELEFTTHVFSSVRFAPLVQHPKMKTIIPARIWNPSFHHLFPDSYQQSIMSLFLCSNSQYSQPLRPVVKADYTNLAATLPRDVWIHIISFTNRKWFESEPPQTEYLRKRICEEQALTSTAQQALLDAKARCYAAERERDIYRHMARRWHSRLQTLLQQRVEQSSSSSSDAIPLPLNAPFLMHGDEGSLFEVNSSRIRFEDSLINLGSSTDDESSLEEGENYTGADAIFQSVEHVASSVREEEGGRRMEVDTLQSFRSIHPESRAQHHGGTDINVEEEAEHALLMDITSITNGDPECTSNAGAVRNTGRQRRTVSISNDSL